MDYFKEILQLIHEIKTDHVISAFSNIIFVPYCIVHSSVLHLKIFTFKYMYVCGHVHISEGLRCPRTRV